MGTCISVNKIIIKRKRAGNLTRWLCFAISLKGYAQKLVLVRGDIHITPKNGKEDEVLRIIDDYRRRWIEVKVEGC